MEYHRLSSSNGWNSAEPDFHCSSVILQGHCKQSTHILRHDTVKRKLQVNVKQKKRLRITTHENNKAKSSQRIVDMIDMSASEGTSPVDDVIQTASLGHREVLAVIVAFDGGLWVEVF